MSMSTYAQGSSDSPSFAPIEEVVITAQRRSEASVDVPISVTSLSADQLASASVDDLSGISSVTPSLRFDFAGAYVQPTIRGIGTSVVTSGGGSNVGIYIDGFYSPNPIASDFDLLNLSSIAVLKGPQGTLFGRNTTGGAILVETSEPSEFTAGAAKASYSRFNERKLQGYFTSGLTDTIAFDTAAQYKAADGWQRNISNGHTVGDSENWSSRSTLKFQIFDNAELLLRYLHEKRDDPSALLGATYQDDEIGSGAPYFATLDQVTYNRSEVASGSNPYDQEYQTFKSDVGQATLKVDLGFADLVSYTQYRAEDTDFAIDLDFSGATTLEPGLPNINRTISQEFILTSTNSSRLQWTSGIFYLKNRDTYDVYYNYAPAFGILEPIRSSGSSTTTETTAVYLDATFQATEKLFATAGLRYAYDDVSEAYFYYPFGYPNRVYVSDLNSEAADKVGQSHVTPRFVLRYKPNERSSIYASYTEGYKSALLDVGGSTGNYVKPEKITAYELGIKTSLRSVRFESSAFYYDYRDLQVSQYEGATAALKNAAKSEIYGVDGQINWNVTQRLDVNAGGAYVHARYKNFENAPFYIACTSVAPPESCGIASFIVAQGITLENVTMQRTPKFTGNVGARYHIDPGYGEITLSGNLYHSSSFYFGPSGVQFKENGYTTLSLRAEWTAPSGNYTVALYGDNVTNERYLTQVQYGNFGIGSNWSRPAVYGVELGVQF